jgi:hypothetical protein
LKISQKIIAAALVAGLSTAAFATPTYTVKMTNAAPIQLKQAFEINYFLIRKADGKPGSTDGFFGPNMGYAPADTTLKDMIGKSLASAQQQMPGDIQLSDLDHGVSNNFQGELLVVDPQGNHVYYCMTPIVNYPDPDNGHYTVTVTGPDTCTLTNSQ